MKPSPRHSKCGRSTNTSASASSALDVALLRDDALVLVLDLAAALGELARIMWIDCRTSSGSKPEITTGLP